MGQIAKKAVFYTDKPPGDFNVFNNIISGRRVCQTILEHLKVEEVVFLNACPVAGFESGIDWSGFKEQGVSAVVLYDCSDVVACGIKAEAENAGLQLFRIVGDKLFDLWNLKISGGEFVLLLNKLVSHASK